MLNNIKMQNCGTETAFWKINVQIIYIVTLGINVSKNKFVLPDQACCNWSSWQFNLQDSGRLAKVEWRSKDRNLVYEQTGKATN